MNKYFLKIVIAGILSIGSLGFAQTTANLQRNITRVAQTQQAEVKITLDWFREVEMREFMVRPARGGIHKSKIVLDKKTKQTQCKGVLTQAGQVVMPAVCAKQGNWQLSQFTLTFANGKKGIGNSKAFRMEGEVVYIEVVSELTKGLVGLPLAVTPKGKSLEEHYGKGILDTIASFFRSKGVACSERYYRPGKVHYGDSTLQVGDAILYKGKLVALVKDSVKHVHTVSEKPLAILR
ncbi:MAG: hypothetical protein J5601_05510 [Elusimicrobiaceae bacterium]|nr:hypothetical protein [Elusimicrobiaceae bacterium]